MTRVVERATVVGFGACLVLLGTVSAAAWMLARTSVRTMDQLDREHRIQDAMSDLLLQVVSIESGQRGFVITGNEDYLAPAEDASRRIGDTLRTLRLLAEASDADAAVISELVPLVERRVELARRIIEARRTQGFEAAKAIVDTGESFALGMQIRGLLAEARHLQAQVIAAQDAAQDAAATRMLVVVIAGSVLSVLVAGAAYLTVRRHGRALATAQNVSRGLAAIVESSNDSIISKDLDGKILTWNASAERLYGYLAEEAIGQSISLIIPPERRAEMDHILDRLRRGEHLHHFDTVRVRKDGSRVNISLTASPVKDAAGAVVGVSLIVRDISERKMAEQEREQLIASLQQALAHVKTLRGMLPICAWCKSIRDDDGYWNQVEAYLARHSDAEFTHGICPKCLDETKQEIARTTAEAAGR